ncbi:response regulator [Deinococcus pimensis]|uniref:response regulator n=1 Tax=Deinococcus pimensis TaxID=309888 RepID=UPI00048885FB|nr:response regulator [Deinococcus pimensis]
MGDLPTVLVVDDNPAHLELTREAFAEVSPGVRVVDAGTAEAALDVLRATADVVRLVLLDLNLPGTDGFEVLRVIRASPALVDLPVVILTTSHADADVRRSREYGASAYLLKPLGFAEHVSMIRGLVGFWLGGGADKGGAS